MNGLAPPFYGKGNMGYQGDECMMIWDAAQMISDGFSAHHNDLGRMLDVAHNLRQILENTRAMYNASLAERDKALRKLQDFDNKLLQLENVVRRYTVAHDPVIASDGYTYERAALKQYLSDCASTNSKAYSQQTKEELTDMFVPNHSLKRLVELLKGNRTTEMPQLPHRGPIASVPGGGNQGGNHAPRALATGSNNNNAMWTEEDAAIATPAPIGTGGRAADSAAAAAAGRHPNAPAAQPVGRRLDGGKKQGGAKSTLHPCLRVYGFCNFMDDCTFANYPYEACLNHIKGKCRFGSNCKELHVDPRTPAYLNPRSNANMHGHGTNSAAPNSSTNATAGGAAAPAQAKSTDEPEKTVDTAATVTASTTTTAANEAAEEVRAPAPAAEEPAAATEASAEGTMEAKE